MPTEVENQQNHVVLLEDEKKKLQQEHFKEMYRLYYKLMKLTERHDAQMKESQAIINEKDKKIKSLEQQLQQSNKDKQMIKLSNLQHQIESSTFNLKEFNLEQNVAQLRKENQELTRVLKIYEQLEDIFIEKKELRPMAIYNRCSKAVQKGFISNEQYVDLKQNFHINDDAWYLNLPEQILNVNTIQSLLDLLIKNSWKGLEYLCAATKTSFQIKQKSLIDDQLWKALIQKKEGELKRFCDLKILDLKNHKILSIAKGDLGQFESLKKVDLSTIQIDRSNEEVKQKYKQSITVLKEFANEHPYIKVRATLPNGQQAQWYQNKLSFPTVTAN